MAFQSKNIARSQKAAPSTSHQLSRCQVVLAKRSFVRNWVFEFCDILILSFVTIWVFKMCHNWSIWDLLQFEFWSCHNLILFWFCHNLICLVCLFDFLRVVITKLFEFCNNLRIWVFFLKILFFELSQFRI